MFHPSSFCYSCRLIFFSSMWYTSCVVLRLLLYSHWENWSLNTSQPYLPNNYGAAGLGWRRNEGCVGRRLPACFSSCFVKGILVLSLHPIFIYIFIRPPFSSTPLCCKCEIWYKDRIKKSSDLKGTNQINKGWVQNKSLLFEGSIDYYRIHVKKQTILWMNNTRCDVETQFPFI